MRGGKVKPAELKTRLVAQHLRGMEEINMIQVCCLTVVELPEWKGQILSSTFNFDVWYSKKE